MHAHSYQQQAIRECLHELFQFHLRHWQLDSSNGKCNTSRPIQQRNLKSSQSAVRDIQQQSVSNHFIKIIVIALQAAVRFRSPSIIFFVCVFSFSIPRSPCEYAKW